MWVALPAAASVRAARAAGRGASPLSAGILRRERGLQQPEVVRGVVLWRGSRRGCARGAEACGWPCPRPARRSVLAEPAEASGGHTPAFLSDCASPMLRSR